MPAINLSRLTAAEISSLVTSGEVTARDMVDASLARIEALSAG